MSECTCIPSNFLISDWNQYIWEGSRWASKGVLSFPFKFNESRQWVQNGFPYVSTVWNAAVRDVLENSYRTDATSWTIVCSWQSASTIALQRATAYSPGNWSLACQPGQRFVLLVSISHAIQTVALSQSAHNGSVAILQIRPKSSPPSTFFRFVWLASPFEFAHLLSADFLMFSF